MWAYTRCWCEISLYYQRVRHALQYRVETQKPFYGIVMFLIFSEENRLENHVVTKRRGVAPVWYLSNGLR